MAEGKIAPPTNIAILLALLDALVAGVATYMMLSDSPASQRMTWTIVFAVIGLVIGAGVAFLGYSRGKLVGPQHHPPTRASSLVHEIGTHGLSPAGQAVGDPDAPPSSPAAPVDSKVREE